MSETKEIKPFNGSAFVVAMIGGPLIFTVLTFWLAFIPVYALVFGGIPYLVIGTPMAIWMALTGAVTVERSMAWAGLTIMAITIPAACIFAFSEGTEAVGAAFIIGLVCAVFGMGWAAGSGWIYAAMTKGATQGAVD